MEGLLSFVYHTLEPVSTDCRRWELFASQKRRDADDDLADDDGDDDLSNHILKLFVQTNFWHLIFMSECVCLNCQSFKMEMEEIYMSTIVLSPKVVLCDPEVFF